MTTLSRTIVEPNIMQESAFNLDKTLECIGRSTDLAMKKKCNTKHKFQSATHNVHVSLTLVSSVTTSVSGLGDAYFPDPRS
jgi:hypothetical protein